MSGCKSEDCSIGGSNSFHNFSVFQPGLRVKQEIVAELEHVCRVCLALDVKMYLITEYKLHQMYEQTTGVHISQDDGLPKNLCWECLHRLKNGFKFRRKALKAQLLLNEILYSGRYITKEDIKEKTQIENCLTSTLIQTSVRVNDFDLDVRFADENVKIEPEDTPYESDDETGIPETNELKRIKVEVTDEIIVSNSAIVTRIPSDSSKFTKENSSKDYLNVNISNDRHLSPEMYVEIPPKTQSSNVNLEDSAQENNIDDSEIFCNKTENESRGSVVDALIPCGSRSSIKEKPTNKKDIEKKFSCHICHLKYAKKFSLSCHLRTHAGEKPFKCEFCDFKSTVLGVVKSHLKFKHKKGKKYACKLCDYKCVAKNNFLLHLERHAEEKPYSCNICDTMFSNKDALVEHDKEKHTKRNETYPCDICEFNTNDKGSLNAHNLEHMKPFKCEYCDYKYSSDSGLKKHVETKHNKPMKYSCHICDLQFSQRRYLNIHLREHKNSQTNENTIACDVCDYKTTRKDLYEAHQRTHTGEKPYICDICDFRCAVKTHIRLHIRRIHTNERNKICHICKFKFVTKSDLSRHLRTHTGEKPYKCEYCDYTSASKHNLQDHVRYKHTKEKPFACDLCDYKCVSKSSLVIHFRKHTGDKPYRCYKCSYAASQYPRLKSHLLSKHRS